MKHCLTLHSLLQDASRQAQVMAAVSLGASNTDKSQAESLIDASQDVLSSYLDKEVRLYPPKPLAN